MTELPTAIFWAEIIERHAKDTLLEEAAIELRCLHAENERLKVRAARLAHQLNANNPLLDAAADELDRLEAEVKRLKQGDLVQPAGMHDAVYRAIIEWDTGGGKRSRRELTRRIVALCAHYINRESNDD